MLLSRCGVDQNSSGYGGVCIESTQIPAHSKTSRFKIGELHARTLQIEKSSDENKTAIERIDTRLRAIESGKSSLLTRPDNHRDKDDAYARAARTIRVWPIDGADQESMSRNLDEFFKKALLITDQDFNSIIIEDIQIQIVQRNRGHIQRQRHKNARPLTCAESGRIC